MNNVSSYITKNSHLLYNYRCEYIAISNRIIAHSNNIQSLIEKASQIDEKFTIYYVPKHISQIKLYPIHIKSISTHEWQPLYPVSLKNDDNEILNIEALIDSVADITCIPFKIGVELGFIQNAQELPQKAIGIGGETDYLLRQLDIIIDNHTNSAPVAWLLSKDEHELIIGRAIIFDNYDITFKQKDEDIIFTFREPVCI